MSKRKALGGDASDEEYAAFPYVISGLEREIRALKRQVQRLENLNKANESYFVPHYYSAEDLGLNDDEVDDFKDYLCGGGSYLDEIDRLMESEVECFRINRVNNDDDEDNN